MSTEPESICAKARRVTQDRWASEKAAKLATEEIFIKGIVGDEFTRNEDGSYQICGRRFVYSDSPWSYLMSPKVDPHLCTKDRWKDLPLGWSGRIRTLDDLGQELIMVDKQVEAYETRYPNTRWGRIKMWWAK